MTDIGDGPLKPLKPASILSPGFLLALFLFTYNNVVNSLPRTLHMSLYIWMNSGVLCLVWILCRRYLHLTLSDLGWTKQNIGKSIIYGLGVSALVMLPAMILAWLFPALTSNIKTPQLQAMARELFWWRLLVHIPVGTAFFEEMLFRGIFYGYVMKNNSQAKTVLVTSIFFGLWHIVPTLRVVSHDLVITSPLLFISLWLLFLLGTFVGGILFGWIRYHTQNIAGCIIAHALINMLSLAGAFLVGR